MFTLHFTVSIHNRKSNLKKGLLTISDERLIHCCASEIRRWSIFIAFLDILKLRRTITLASALTYSALKTHCTEAHFRDQACHQINASVLLTFNYRPNYNYKAKHNCNFDLKTSYAFKDSLLWYFLLPLNSCVMLMNISTVINSSVKKIKKPQSYYHLANLSLVGTVSKCLFVFCYKILHYIIPIKAIYNMF